MDIHIKSHRTKLYKSSIVNMGSTIYNKLPDHMKEIDSYKVFKKQLKSFLLLHVLFGGRILIIMMIRK